MLCQTKLINLFAGPSSGKTTAAAGLFHWMKSKRMNIEVAPEFAKDIVWDGAFSCLDDQISIFGEQHRRIYRLLGKVDFIITDSPLLFSLVYGKEGLQKYEQGPWFDKFNDFVYDIHCQYDNYNYFVERGDREYIRAGRTQNLEGAKAKDKQILKMLDDLQVNYNCVRDYTEILADLDLN